MDLLNETPAFGIDRKDATPATSISWDGRRHSYRPSASWRSRISPDLELHRDFETDVDPVTYEVIRHRLWIVNMAHGDTILRISGSPVLAATDFNMAMLTEDAEVVLNAPYIQFLTAGAPLAVRYILEKYSSHPGIREGDIYLSNDPWIGASHQMDVLIACPVFIDGRLFAWATNAGHQYDLGGITPGGWPQNAPDVYSDPVCLPPFKIVERGVMRRDLEAVYLRQSRMPDLVALDLRAQLSGAAFARDQIVDLCATFGAPIVKGVMRKILRTAQEAFQEELRKIPDGAWTQLRYLDEPMPGDRTTQRTQVTLTKAGDRLVLDNRGTDAQTIGTNGTTFATFAGSTVGMISVLMLYRQLFAAGGADRQIEYRPEPGLLNCVDHPGETSGGVMQANSLMNAIQTILSRMLCCDPGLKFDVLTAGTDFMLPVLTGVTEEQQFFGQGLIDGYACGGGARSYADGVDSAGPAWSPLSTLLNVEMVEQWFPLLFLYRREGCDSGGAGERRGGVGVTSAFTPYRAQSMEIITNTSGQATSTHGGIGLFGGYPAPASHYIVKRCTNLTELFAARRMPTALEEIEAEATDRLRAKSNGMPMSTGDVFELRIVGGGGYGDPLRRDPDLAARDVRNGHVSRAAAWDVYGVSLAEDLSVDEQATRDRREALILERRAWTPAVTPPATRIQEATPATGEDDREIHEYLVARDFNGVRKLACRECGHVVCDWGENYKEHMLVHAGPVTEVPSTTDPRYYLDDPMEFRRYCCPGCLVLTATEIVRADEPIIPDMLFH